MRVFIWTVLLAAIAVLLLGGCRINFFGGSDEAEVFTECRVRGNADMGEVYAGGSRHHVLVTFERGKVASRNAMPVQYFNGEPLFPSPRDRPDAFIPDAAERAEAIRTTLEEACLSRNLGKQSLALVQKALP